MQLDRELNKNVKSISASVFKHLSIIIRVKVFFFFFRIKVKFLTFGIIRKNKQTKKQQTKE